MKITDTHWNSIYSVELKSWTQYILHLAWEHYPRILWVLNDKNQFIVKRDRDKHLLDKAKSYGFNEHLLRTVLKPDTMIIVQEKWRKERLRVLVSDVLWLGNYLFFLQQWFEKQLFLPLTKFKIA